MEWVKASDRNAPANEDIHLIVNYGSIGEPVESLSAGHYDKERNAYKDEMNGFYVKPDKVQWLDESSPITSDKELIGFGDFCRVHSADPAFTEELLTKYRNHLKG